MKNIIIIDGVSYTRTDLVATLKSEVPTKTKEERFWQLFNGVIKEDKEKHPDSIFSFTKEGEFLWQYNSKNKRCWMSWKSIWSVFETEFNMSYQETQDFTSSLLEKHFKCKGLTTGSGMIAVGTMLEKHFKCKGLTTK